MIEEFIVTENMEEGLDTVETKEKAEELLYEGNIDAYLPIKAENREEAISKFYEEQDKRRESTPAT